MTTTISGAGSPRHTTTSTGTTTIGADDGRHLSRRPAPLADDARATDVIDPESGRESAAGGVVISAAAVVKALFFVIGCALLVGCAFALDRLGAWSADYGRVLVFLGFFLVMSVGGRWFWAGADAAIGWVRGRVGR